MIIIIIIIIIRQLIRRCNMSIVTTRAPLSEACILLKPMKQILTVSTPAFPSLLVRIVALPPSPMRLVSSHSADWIILEHDGTLPVNINMHVH